MSLRCGGLEKDGEGWRGGGGGEGGEKDGEVCREWRGIVKRSRERIHFMHEHRTFIYDDDLLCLKQKRT